MDLELSGKVAIVGGASKGLGRACAAVLAEEGASIMMCSRSGADLEQAAGHRLMEINQSATELLLKGTVAEGLPDWDQGRPQPVKYIDFENWANNDFLVINQFKVELTSGRGHVIPDAVLFVNGIPLAVAEFKSPGIENPLQQAINQLLRYSNQRRELFPTQYSEDEGVERSSILPTTRPYALTSLRPYAF